VSITDGKQNFFSIEVIAALRKGWKRYQTKEKDARTMINTDLFLISSGFFAILNLSSKE